MLSPPSLNAPGMISSFPSSVAWCSVHLTDIHRQGASATGGSNGWSRMSLFRTDSK